MDGRPDLTDVDWVVVPLAVCGGVGVVGVLPCLGDGAVVPDVAVVGEAVGNKPGTGCGVNDLISDNNDNINYLWHM